MADKRERSPDYWANYSLGETHALRKAVFLCVGAVSSLAGKDAVLDIFTAVRATTKDDDPAPEDGFIDGFDSVFDELVSYLAKSKNDSEAG